MKVDFNKISEAVKDRDDFLSEHPELWPLQDEINSILVKSGKNPIRRCLILQQMMLETWYKITTV